MNPIGPYDDSWPDRAGAAQWIADEVVDAEHFLAELIRDDMRHERGLSGGHIVVAVQNGVVILDGWVGSDRMREAVLARVRSIPGVFDVCCDLSVRPHRP